MLEDLDRDALLKVMARDREVKADLAQRLASVTAENCELYALIHELEADLAEARQHTHEPQPDA